MYIYSIKKKILSNYNSATTRLLFFAILTAVVYRYDHRIAMLIATCTILISFKLKNAILLITIYIISNIFLVNLYVVVDKSEYYKDKVLLRTIKSNIIVDKKIADNFTQGDLIYANLKLIKKSENYYRKQFRLPADYKQIKLPIISNIIKFRSDKLNDLYYLSGGKLTLPQALIFGDKSYISDDVRDKYIITGLAHLLAISGMHIGIIVTIVVTLLIFLPFKLRLIPLAIILIFMIPIAGFSITVLRASLFTIFFIVTYLFDYATNSKKFLLILASLFIIFSPNTIKDISFLLSFAAVFGILYLLNNDRYKEDDKNDASKNTDNTNSNITHDRDSESSDSNIGDSCNSNKNNNDDRNAGDSRNNYENNNDDHKTGENRNNYENNNNDHKTGENRNNNNSYKNQNSERNRSSNAQNNYGIKNYFTTMIMVGVAATILTTPISLYYFGTTNFASIISTVIMLPFIYIQIILGILTVIAPTLFIDALVFVEHISLIVLDTIYNLTYITFTLKNIPLPALIVTMLFAVIALTSRYKYIAVFALLIFFYPAQKKPVYIFPDFIGSTKGFVAFNDNRSEIYFSGSVSQFKYTLLPILAQYGVKKFDYGMIRVFSSTNEYIKIENEGTDFKNICLNNFDNNTCEINYITKSNTININNINNDTQYIIYRNKFKADNILESSQKGIITISHDGKIEVNNDKDID